MTTEFTFNGKTHTVAFSCIPAGAAFAALRAAYAARGIGDKVNARIGHANRYAQFYIMHDGSIKPASDLIDGEVVRSLKTKAA